ncbi:hypothetical protein ACQP1V_42865 (plasmid) [Microtetraspora malaysiensis]|uniref:hypothetical protein n=1 Tax=Microtetraspora malaysiensis TaxID=161358 RepID=UPI003D8B81CB
MRFLAPSPERERARLEAEQVRIEQERLRAEARHERALQQVQHQADVARQNAILAEERKAHVAAEAQAERERTRARHREQRERWTERTRAAGRLAVMSITNLGVNLVAVTGQALAFVARGWPTPAAAVAAGIIESVAVYVSWHAHVALREGDAAWRLRMTSYAIGAAAGYLSYTHVPDYPELFAACSLASPWLWSMHSRHLHRKDLREQQLIDPRAPKFSFLRWVLHGKETFAAFRWAVGEGVQSPQTSVGVVRERRQVLMTRQSVQDAQAAVVAAQRAQLELTLTQMAALSQELYGMDPDAAAEMEKIARFIKRVGGGMFPMYRPQLAGALEVADEVADEKRTDVADEASADGGRTADGLLRRILLRRGRSASTTADEKRTDGGRTATRTADGGRTNVADEKRTDDGRTADERRPSGRTKSADGAARPRGRAAVKAADDGRTDKRTVRARVNGRTTRTSGRAAGEVSVSHLLPHGRAVRTEHEERKEKLTRDSLAAALKARGLTISNERAGQLLALIREDASSGSASADESGSSARTKTGTDDADGRTDRADEKRTNSGDGEAVPADDITDGGTDD